MPRIPDDPRFTREQLAEAAAARAALRRRKKKRTDEPASPHAAAIRAAVADVNGKKPTTRHRK
ncbi:hypothetical protein [Streptodolium elevatio]|uniref:Transcriptional regulator n=1 Tax=Streptodolium elevatio TaxID=3157996 RepID=A0ABV3DFS9_9ACTN